MSKLTFGIGKGLREPCSPFRLAGFFGAELNSVNADNWNCVPEIVSRTATFDLSMIPKNREVVVALLGVDNTLRGLYNVNFSWFRERDNALLFDYSFSWDTAADSWFYGYSYIGWLDREINENGSYRVVITLTGVESLVLVERFVISGIPSAPIPEPPPSRFMDSILTLVGSVTTFFEGAYQAVRSWVWPFNILQYPLYGIYTVTGALRSPISVFGEWVEGIAARIMTILSTFDIGEFFKDIFEAAINAWNWIQNAPSYITGLINLWFGTVTSTILGWIDIAKQGLVTLINMAQFGVNMALSWVNNFTSTTLPALASWSGVTDLISSALASFVPDLSAIWSGVTDLIDSTILSWFPFYDDLVSIWNDLIAFFTNPLDFLVGRLEDWFWGEEEE